MVRTTCAAWPHLSTAERIILIAFYPLWSLAWCVFWLLAPLYPKARP